MNKFLNYLALVSSIGIAGIAAYFSVIGLATIFAGAYLGVVIMTGALEFGKLVTAAYLHLKWDILGKQKYYLAFSVVVLMFITSLGIFGYLAKASSDTSYATQAAQAEADRFTTQIERQNECKRVWENIDNIEGHFIEDSKFIKDKDEDEWVNLLETKFDISEYDCIISPSSDDSHFEHKIVSDFTYALVRRSKCGIIQYKSPSTLDNWTPNFFVDLSVLQHRDKEDGHSQDTHTLFGAFLWYIKLNKLKRFESQQDKSYFEEESIKSFHSNYQCTTRGMIKVESFKIIRGYN